MWKHDVSQAESLCCVGTIHLRDVKAPSFKEFVQYAKLDAERNVWPKVTDKEDAKKLKCRDLFTYALILCEADEHPKRIPKLLQRASQMQNLNEES